MFCLYTVRYIDDIHFTIGGQLAKDYFYKTPENPLGIYEEFAKYKCIDGVIREVPCLKLKVEYQGFGFEYLDMRGLHRRVKRPRFILKCKKQLSKKYANLIFSL